MSELWVPDVLGRPFEQHTLPLGEDDEGELVATMVRRVPRLFGRVGRPLRNVDVLYVHGWSDFFYQTELAEFWNSLGARFFALDLRKYGRSLRPGQTPGYVADLASYDVEIEAALRVMGHDFEASSSRSLVLMGHSTGGMILTLWAQRHPTVANALILNSPWLELQLGAVGRQALAPLVDIRARLDPRGSHPAVDLGYYTRARATLQALPDASIPAEWHPERGFPTHPAWLAAILSGHRRIAQGVDVGCPALVLLSARSSSPFTWSEVDAQSTDTVLVVDDIARRATRIGSLVTVARIHGAIHDVLLSAPEARADSYRVLRDWILGRRPVAGNATGS